MKHISLAILISLFCFPAYACKDSGVRYSYYYYAMEEEVFNNLPKNNGLLSSQQIEANSLFSSICVNVLEKKDPGAIIGCEHSYTKNGINVIAKARYETPNLRNPFPDPLFSQGIIQYLNLEASYQESSEKLLKFEYANGSIIENKSTKVLKIYYGPASIPRCGPMR